MRATKRACSVSLDHAHPIREHAMNLARLLCLSCCLIALQGCFDNSDNETKDNTDGTKSSVQMQDKDAADK